MRIAVFGDVHGALPDVYDHVQAWEKAYAQEVDLVLLAGDVGLFRSRDQMDSATLRHAEDDPRELQAIPYVQGEKKASHPTAFVRGNHEDFELLRSRRGDSVDPHGMIRELPDGEAVTAGDGDEAVSILGLGGIDPVAPRPDGKLSEAGVPDPQAWRPWHDDDLPRGGVHFAVEPWRKASNLEPGSVDVLLTHDGPAGYGLERQEGAGSYALRALVERLQPAYHFFGHYDEPPEPGWIGETRVVPMNQGDVVQLPGRDGGMGVLDTGAMDFGFVYPGQI